MLVAADDVVRVRCHRAFKELVVIGIVFNNREALSGFNDKGDSNQFIEGPIDFCVTHAMESLSVSIAQDAMILGENIGRKHEFECVAFEEAKDSRSDASWRPVSADYDICIDNNPHGLALRPCSARTA